MILCQRKCVDQRQASIAKDVVKPVVQLSVSTKGWEYPSLEVGAMDVLNQHDLGVLWYIIH